MLRERLAGVKKIPYPHVSDALIGISIKMIFRDYDLGIVVGYSEQISKLPVDGLLSVQPECHLDIESFVFPFANEVNFLGM